MPLLHTKQTCIYIALLLYGNLSAHALRGHASAERCAQVLDHSEEWVIQPITKHASFMSGLSKYAGCPFKALSYHPHSMSSGYFFKLSTIRGHSLSGPRISQNTRQSGLCNTVSIRNDVVNNGA